MTGCSRNCAGAAASCETTHPLLTRAWREIERGSAWWRRHRDKAPDAFDDDTDAAIDRIRSEPHIGTPTRARRLGVRALWIERIGYFLYYTELPDGVIEILALWHASRGSRPKL